MKRAKPITKQDLALVLRNLEHQGLIESRLHEDGKVRWHITDKGLHVNPDEVPINLELLN